MQGTGILPCRKSEKKRGFFRAKYRYIGISIRAEITKSCIFAFKRESPTSGTRLEMLALSYKNQPVTQVLITSNRFDFFPIWMEAVWEKGWDLYHLWYSVHTKHRHARGRRHHIRGLVPVAAPHPKGGKLGSSHTLGSAHMCIHSLGQHWANWVLRLESPYHLARLFTSTSF